MEKTIKITILILSVFVILILAPFYIPYILNIVHPYGVVGRSDVDQKVYAIAVEKKKISICDKVHVKPSGYFNTSKGGARSSCYNYYASQFPREDICMRLITDPSYEDRPGSNATSDAQVNYGSFTMCIFAQAEAASDSSICLKIDESISRYTCVKFIAHTSKDLNKCSVLTDDNQEQKCREGSISPQ